MSPAAEFQKAMFERLLATPAVTDLIGDRVFDRMPSDGDYPCVTFGPSDEVPDDADCVNGVEHTLQIDVWSRDNGRVRPCKDIASAVRDAVHEIDLDLPDPYAAVFTRVILVRVMIEPDGTTAHGVVTVVGALEVVSGG